MSRVCVFNFVDEIKDYERLCYVVNELIQTALDNGIGISFNSDYYDLNSLPEFKIYFLLSDSFVYRHSDELLSPNGLWDGEDMESFKENFIDRFKIFEILIDKLFMLGINRFEIYFIDVNTPVEEIKNFESVKTTGKEFSLTLLKTVLEESEEWGCTIPNDLKFQIEKTD